jgi:hypothetical protein
MIKVADLIYCDRALSVYQLWSGEIIDNLIIAWGEDSKLGGVEFQSRLIGVPSGVRV